MRYVLSMIGIAAAAVSAAAQTAVSNPARSEPSRPGMLAHAIDSTLQPIGLDLADLLPPAPRVNGADARQWARAARSETAFGREPLFNDRFAYATNDHGLRSLLRTATRDRGPKPALGGSLAWAVTTRAPAGGYTPAPGTERSSSIAYDLLNADRVAGAAPFFDDRGGNSDGGGFSDLNLLVALVPLPRAAAVAAGALGLLALAAARRR